MKNRMPTKQSKLFPVWLMRSKVNPTKNRLELLSRPPLLKALDTSIDGTLTLLGAPAGYGKSTLLSDWRDQLLERNINVCWLSIDEEDNDTFQLLSYIAYSLYIGGVDFEASGIDDDSFLSQISTRKLLNIISHAVDSHQQKLVLIIDDFEHLNQAIVDSAIKPLLSYAPPNLHISIATRDTSCLKVTQLESAGLVTRLNAQEMRFTPVELGSLLPKEISKADISKVYSFTEGWPVAVQMLRGPLNKGRSLNSILKGFSDSSSLLTSYLSEEIFSGMEVDLQQFLMTISLVDRASEELANFLMETDYSAQQFDRLRSLDTLILPVQGLENTHRLHPLFREYLIDKFALTNPTGFLAMQLKTASWFEMQGNIVRAISHCLEADHPGKAEEIFANAGGIWLWLREGLTRLRAILKLFSEKSTQESPRIKLIQCLIDIKDGKIATARKNLNALQTLLNNNEKAIEQEHNEQLSHEVMIIGSTLNCYEGNVMSRSHCDALDDKIRRIDPGDSSTLGHHYTLLCVGNAQRGQFKKARSYAEKATQAFKQISSIYGEAYIAFHLGDISFAQGKSVAAENYYQKGLELARKHFNDDVGFRLVAYVFIAELKYELDQLDSLPQAIETIPKQLEEREAWFDIYAAGYITASNIEFIRHGIEAALYVIDCASAYADAENLSRLNYMLEFQRVLLHLRAGDLVKAQYVVDANQLNLERYELAEDDSIAWRERDAAVHALNRLYIHNKEYSKAIKKLNHFIQISKQHSHLKSYLRYEILLVIALYKNSNIKESHAHLVIALKLSIASQFKRFFIDEAAELLPIFESFIKLHTADKKSETFKYASQLLGVLSENPPSTSAKDILSKREREVLEQLSMGHSNKIIARNIGVSENTVRFHLKNIFAKLNANSRHRAVEIARSINLL